MNNEENSFMSPEESYTYTAKLTYGLGTVPCSLNVETVKESNKLFIPAHYEWLIAATAMFGGLNKLIDGLNIPLEL